jgi:cytochrome c oxidase cbb3-type subunit 4
MDLHVLSGVFTGVLIAVYLGIFGWAWSPRRRGDFEQAARLPFADHADDAGEL